MRHSWRGVLSALLALSLAVPACAAPVDGETAAARKEDLEFLYQTLERAHPDLFANTPEERFLERKAAIETGLEEADDFTFALELQSLTALAGDSHTTLALGGSMSQTVHYYPMSLLHRDGRWYLSAAPTDRRQRQEYGGDGGGLWGGAQRGQRGEAAAAVPPELQCGGVL